MIPEFRVIWDRDESKTKDKALQELSYVYFMAAYQSPYRAYEENERKLKVTQDIIHMRSWSPDEVIQKALVKFEELEMTPTLALLKDTEAGIYKLREFMNTVDLRRDDTGSKTRALITTLGKISDVVKALEVLKLQVEKEQRVGQTGRAGRQINPRELPKEKRLGNR